MLEINVFCQHHLLVSGVLDLHCPAAGFPSKKKNTLQGLLLQSLLRQGPVSNDEFSIPFMEQCTLDAIEVKIPTAGGLPRCSENWTVHTDAFCVAFSQQWPTHLSQPEIQKQADMVQSQSQSIFAFDNISKNKLSDDCDERISQPADLYLTKVS